VSRVRQYHRLYTLHRTILKRVAYVVVIYVRYSCLYISALFALPLRTLRLMTLNRKVRKGLAKLADTCSTYAPFPTNISFSFELQPSPCIPRAMRARCP